MEYIVHRRFKTKAICGDVNIPARTICEVNGSMITIDGKPLCVVTSENAHLYFARNDDGKGLERGKIVKDIIRLLLKDDGLHQVRLDKVWDDPLCQKYRRTEHTDNWLWNHAFFNASMEHLTHIWQLIKSV